MNVSHVTSLFPDCVHVVIARPDDVPDDSSALFPEEIAAVAASVPSRRREFTMGRWCAREALKRMGSAPVAIPVGRGRAPRWPIGVVGSITHCDGFVGAAVTPAASLQAIGFDAELRVPLDLNLVSFVCTNAEKAWSESAPHLRDIDWPKVIFSGKESVHKCIYPIHGRILEFVDVQLRLDAERGTFDVETANQSATIGIDLAAIRGRFAVVEGFVLTGATIAS